MITVSLFILIVFVTCLALKQNAFLSETRYCWFSGLPIILLFTTDYLAKNGAGNSITLYVLFNVFFLLSLGLSVVLSGLGIKLFTLRPVAGKPVFKLLGATFLAALPLIWAILLWGFDIKISRILI